MHVNANINCCADFITGFQSGSHENWREIFVYLYLHTL